MPQDQQPSLGIRLTVQCEDPQDPFFQPKDFFPSSRQEEICIGRAGGTDIQLANPGVSGIHCRILQQEGAYFIDDTGSRNGTLVNNQRLSPGEPRRLRYGEIIRVLNYHITIQPGLSAFAPEAEENIDDTFQIERDVVQMFLDDPDEHPPYLELLAGTRVGHKYELSGYEDIKIGRAPECQIALPDDGISREHALLRRDWTGVTLRDLNSRNGLSLNGRLLGKNVEVHLNDGDEFGLGHHLFVFRDPFGADFSDKLQGLVDFDVLGEDGGSIDGETIAPRLLSTPNKENDAEPSSGSWRSPDASSIEIATTQEPAEEGAAAEEPSEQEVKEEKSDEEAAQEASAEETEGAPLEPTKARLRPVQILLLFLLSLFGLTLVALMLSLLLYSY